LSACYHDFPAGTIFVSVVDPEVGSKRRAIAAASNGHTFVSPDNGSLSLVLAGDLKVVSIENGQFFRGPVSSTFHGRDIFAPVAAHLSAGAALEELGPIIDDPVVLPGLQSRRPSQNVIEGCVVHIDRFGNLVTNITAEEAGTSYTIEIGGDSIAETRQYYSGAEPDQPFAIAGSAGFIEISINPGSAARRLNAEVGMAVKVILKGTT
jgi:S-adenosylmethionine hydrolase